MKNLLFVFFLFFVNPAIAFASTEKPTISIPTFSGKNFNLENYHDKVVIVNFWAYWCMDCRKEMVVLEEIYKKYNARGVEIIGISIDSKREKNRAMQVAGEFSYPNSIYYEANEINIPEPDSIPMNYVIKNGKIIAKIIGYGENVTKQELEAVLSK